MTTIRASRVPERVVADLAARVKGWADLTEDCRQIWLDEARDSIAEGFDMIAIMPSESVTGRLVFVELPHE